MKILNVKTNKGLLDKLPNFFMLNKIFKININKGIFSQFAYYLISCFILQKVILN